MGCFIESLAWLRRKCLLCVSRHSGESQPLSVSLLNNAAALKGPTERGYPHVPGKDFIFFKTVSIIPYVCRKVYMFLLSEQRHRHGLTWAYLCIDLRFELGSACTAIFDWNSNGWKAKNVVYLRVISIFLILLGIKFSRLHLDFLRKHLAGLRGTIPSC